MVLALVVIEFTALRSPVVGAVPSGFPLPSPALPWTSLPQLLLPGLVIALGGFAEPASIARQYASADRTAWDPDREFGGQGLANLGAGLVGGYPAGGSFSRSALNRLSGARTRWGGFVTGVCVAAMLLASHVLAGLPTAALAGLVIASVLPLLNPAPRPHPRRAGAATSGTHRLTGALVLRAIGRDLDRSGVEGAVAGVQPQWRRLVEAVFADEPVHYTRRDTHPSRAHPEETVDDTPQPGSR